MKVVFLDIDGVLITRKSLTNGQSGLRAKADPQAVKQLNRLIKATGAQIVVSSTWRTAMGPDRLQTLLRDEWGVQGSVIGATPVCNAIRAGIVLSHARGAEIQAWLTLANGSEMTRVQRFVILDDENDMGELSEHLIQTEFETGLMRAHVDLAIDKLNTPSHTPSDKQTKENL